MVDAVAAAVVQVADAVANQRNLIVHYNFEGCGNTGRRALFVSSVRERTMKNANPQFEKDFQSRLENWVSRQGLWFQIRHASGSGAVMRSLFGVGIRLVVLFFILLGIGWFYLTKQVGRDSYTERLKTGLVVGMHASGGKIEGVSRGKTQFLSADLKIKYLELDEGETTFFENKVTVSKKMDAEGNDVDVETEEGLVAEGVTLSPFSILDGIRGGWRGNELNIQRVSAFLKTTADSDALAKTGYATLFQKYQYLDVKLIDVGKVDLEWGYSEKTKARLSGASMSGELLDEGWQLVFKGGKFSYGFLRDVDLQEARVICRPDKIEIRSVLLRVGAGYMQVHGDVEIGAKPKVDCKFKIASLNMEDVVQDEFRSWLGGSVSGEGTITGDLSARDGLDYDIKVELNRQDQLVVDDQFPVMQTMQFVDGMNSYRRFRFGYGRLRFRTEGEDYYLDDIYLRAGIQLYLTGNLVLKMKDKEEVTGEVEVEDEEGNVTAETRVLESGGMKRYYKGGLEMSLQSGVFARSRALREAFALDDVGDLEDDPERYDLPIRVDSFFEGVTKDLAGKIEGIYKAGMKGEE